MQHSCRNLHENLWHIWTKCYELFWEGQANNHSWRKTQQSLQWSTDKQMKKYMKIWICQFTVSELSAKWLNISQSVIYILTKKLRYRKLYDRWVLKMLYNAHRQKYLCFSSIIFAVLSKWIRWIILQNCTGDEAWISYSNVERKQQSIWWWQSSSPINWKTGSDGLIIGAHIFEDKIKKLVTQYQKCV